MMTRIRRISDNKIIGSYVETSDAWSLIQQVVGDEWPCWPTDIDTRENPELEREEITVKDNPVAYLEYRCGWQLLEDDLVGEVA